METAFGEINCSGCGDKITKGSGYMVVDDTLEQTEAKNLCVKCYEEQY